MLSLGQHWIDNVVLQAPAVQTLSITVCSADVDHVTLVMPFSAELMTTPGVFHGGVVAALIDTAGVAASASGISPDDEAAGGATGDLTASFLEPRLSIRSSLLANDGRRSRQDS